MTRRPPSDLASAFLLIGIAAAVGVLVGVAAVAFTVGSHQVARAFGQALAEAVH